MTVPSQASSAEIGPERGCARPMRPPGHGRQICPPWRCPASTRCAQPEREPGQDVGEVAEQDAQVGAHVEMRGGVVVAARAGVRSAEAPAIETRRPFSETLRRRAVEQLEPAEVLGVPALRERVAAVREVVVAEHGERAVARGRDELGGGRGEARSSPAARDEIARDRDEVGLELGGPFDAAAQQDEAGPVARVDVRDVHDGEAVELARDAAERDVAHPLPERERLRSGGGDARRATAATPFSSPSSVV